jgi:hypothetical protein
VEHGFSMRLEIEPREWERKRVLRIAHRDAGRRRERLEPAVHFPGIMQYIARDAEKRYGPDVCRSDPMVFSHGATSP